MNVFNKKSSNNSNKAKTAAPAAKVRQVITPATSTDTEAPSDVPDELVAARAYEMWQRRGSPADHDSTRDWFAAKSELEQERLGWAAPTEQDRA
ncbi:MAG TPA: DUF2934 domain-containing protein [Polyangiales bacterium]|nr:DUF2934 domain-containing protein [Polyangiales bacterium]